VSSKVEKDISTHKNLHKICRVHFGHYKNKLETYTLVFMGSMKKIKLKKKNTFLFENKIEDKLIKDIIYN